MQKSFSYLGMSFPKLTVNYGIFLIIWGALVSVISQSASFTSWIPSFVGIPLFVTGLLTIVLPDRAKLLSHIALTIGLFALLGGLDVFRGVISGSFMQTPAADISKMMLAITGFWYLLVGVKSFRWARQNRIANQ
jgi:hypothetical protein